MATDIRRLLAYARKIPGFEAAQTLRSAQVESFPWLDENDRKQLLSAWQSVAEGSGQERGSSKRGRQRNIRHGSPGSQPSEPGAKSD